MDNVNDFVRDITFAFIKGASNRQADDAALEGGAGGAGAVQGKKGKKKGGKWAYKAFNNTLINNQA